MPSRTWMLSLARLKTRAAERGKLQPSERQLIDDALSVCDAVIAELSDAELQLDRVKVVFARHGADYERLLHLMPAALVTLDGHGRILSANAHAATLLNVSARKLPDRLLLHFVQDRDEFQKLFATASLDLPARATLTVRPRERAPLTMDVHVLCGTPDDTPLYYCFLVTPQRATGGAIDQSLVPGSESQSDRARAPGQQ